MNRIALALAPAFPLALAPAGRLLAEAPSSPPVLITLAQWLAKDRELRRLVPGAYARVPNT